MTGLRRFGPARPTRDASYSVSVRQVAALLPRFFQTAPRGDRPCASLALRLHQTLGRGLSPPSCQTCSAHPELWTHRARPPLLGKPQRGFPQLPQALRLTRSLNDDKTRSANFNGCHLCVRTNLLPISPAPRTKDRRPKTEDQRPKTEDRRPKAEGRRPTTERSSCSRSP